MACIVRVFSVHLFSMLFAFMRSTLGLKSTPQLSSAHTTHTGRLGVFSLEPTWEMKCIKFQVLLTFETENKSYKYMKNIEKMKQVKKVKQN